MALMSPVTSRAKVFLVKWRHVPTGDCICPWHLERNNNEKLETLQRTCSMLQLAGFTVSTSAWQSPSEWNAAVAPKMASGEVFTGIYGYILLCANAWRWEKIRCISGLLQFHTIVRTRVNLNRPPNNKDNQNVFVYKNNLPGKYLDCFK